MMKGGTVSRSEVEQLRRIERVVRMGHVERIEPDDDRARARHGADDARAAPRALRRVRVERQPAAPDLHRRHDHPPARHPPRPDPVGRAAGLPGDDRTHRRSRRTRSARRRRCRTPRSTTSAASPPGSAPSWDGRTHPSCSSGSTAPGSTCCTASATDDPAVRELQGRFLQALFPALEKLQVFAASGDGPGASPHVRSGKTVKEHPARGGDMRSRAARAHRRLTGPPMRQDASRSTVSRSRASSPDGSPVVCLPAGRRPPSSSAA